MFLYILKFKKNNIIKVGVAKSYSRIRSLCQTYGDLEPDIEDSVTVTAPNSRDLKVLETQLLQDYIDHTITDDEFSGRDGCTELRDSSILNSVIDDILRKQSLFPQKQFKIQKLIVPPQMPPRRRSKEELALERELKFRKEIEQSKENAKSFFSCLSEIKNEMDDICFNENNLLAIHFADVSNNSLFHHPIIYVPFDIGIKGSGGFVVQSYRVYNEETKNLSIHFSKAMFAYYVERTYEGRTHDFLVWFLEALCELLGLSIDCEMYLEMCLQNKDLSKFSNAQRVLTIHENSPIYNKT